MLRILSIYPSLSACRSAREACWIARSGSQASAGTRCKALCFRQPASNVERARQQWRSHESSGALAGWLVTGLFGDVAGDRGGGGPRPKTNQAVFFVDEASSSNTPPTTFKLFLSPRRRWNSSRPRIVAPVIISPPCLGVMGPAAVEIALSRRLLS